ncbi:MAG: DUF4065 domain-containing protein [Lachnospiraceae bacterium]|nr:DUF4065 domain-containing protein [Lachnospiraceae bacterium]
MSKNVRQDFCTECRKNTEYEIMKQVKQEIIRDRKYEFTFTTAICKECGEEMDIPGLADLNIAEMDRQYRETEQIISIEDIEKLMDIYHMGKAPLSLALGFGEVTISRYLDGQMPSKNYSDIMKNALASPEYMEKLLKQNRERVGNTAYKKAMKAIGELKELFEISDKMLVSIAYIFEQMQEVTPLVLQKMLYYVQGIYMVLFDMPLFSEKCYAWQHGPVYEKVYFLFKDFKYNPIDDNRFALFSGKSEKLAENEKMVIDLVIKTFGRYSGKVLESITHNERPWQDARKGYDCTEPSRVLIGEEDMKSYFKEISGRYGIDSVEGLNRYIDSYFCS